MIPRINVNFCLREKARQNGWECLGSAEGMANMSEWALVLGAEVASVVDGHLPNAEGHRKAQVFSARAETQDQAAPDSVLVRSS